MSEQNDAHCAHDAAGAGNAHGTHRAGWGGAASATLHCLTGCAIGEFIGLAIGVSLGWQPTATMALAIVLAFVCGYGLTLLPFLRRGVSLAVALKTVWLAEAVSITAMEIAINAVDYSMGGMSVGSVFTWDFWSSYGVALIAGFLAVWPINLWLLRRNLKHCH